MQTLISVFDDRAAARRAIDQLVAEGFARGDVHLRMSRDDTTDPSDHAYAGEREIALDRNALESIGHFFVSLFGQDRGEKAAGSYTGAYERGHALVVVDVHDDRQAEAAAVILHENGAIDVDDQHAGDAMTARPGVRAYARDAAEKRNSSDAPQLPQLAEHRQLREDSLLADRSAGDGSSLKQDREERAYASPMTQTGRDRPK